MDGLEKALSIDCSSSTDQLATAVTAAEARKVVQSALEAKAGST